MVYSNLPRTQVDILNGGLYPKAGKSNKKKSIMIIGTAPYGPINKAIKIGMNGMNKTSFSTNNSCDPVKYFVKNFYFIDNFLKYSL